MPALLFNHDLNPLKELENYQNEHLTAGSYGATASFTGTMRDFNAGDAIAQMTLEHYPRDDAEISRPIV